MSKKASFIQQLNLVKLAAFALVKWISFQKSGLYKMQYFFCPKGTLEPLNKYDVQTTILKEEKNAHTS